MIVVNFPTNIGDTILSLWSLDIIKSNFSKDSITAIASVNTQKFLSKHSFIDKVIVYNKHWSAKEKRNFAFSLRNKYRVFIDFKNSFLPFISGVKMRTPFLRIFPQNTHLIDRNKFLLKKIADINKPSPKGVFVLSPEDKKKWEYLPLTIFVACSSRSTIKCYHQRLLKRVISDLSKSYSVVILGEVSDRNFYGDILGMDNVYDLVGKTSLEELFYIIGKYALGVLAVDSSILHIASYLEKPIVTLFGPTDSRKYGPYYSKSLVLTNQNLSCIPCSSAKCRFNHNQCMQIDPELVLQSVKKIIQDERT